MPQMITKVNVATALDTEKLIKNVTNEYTNSTQVTNNMGNNAIEEVDLTTTLQGNNSEINTNENSFLYKTIDDHGNPITIEIDIEEYTQTLKAIGLTDLDINRVISGEITIEKLMEEIERDDERYRRVLEASYLKNFELSYTDMGELENDINKDKDTLKGLIAKKEKVGSIEPDIMQKILSRLRQGESLESIMESEIVGWKYTDENGEIQYTTNQPTEEIEYEQVTFLDMYGETEDYKELKNTLSKATIKPFFFFGEEETVHRYEGTEEQEILLEKLDSKYIEQIDKRETEQKDIDNKIEELKNQIGQKNILKNMSIMKLIII